ncbi:hypothetical protein GE09DRAFT_1185340 [Coniochaeta sp. 2T2.1]|nr:hypothetical protein GE09DRAFT_1185340 [Coniochaeta sp. 2T2.1]
MAPIAEQGSDAPEARLVTTPYLDSNHRGDTAAAIPRVIDSEPLSTTRHGVSPSQADQILPVSIGSTAHVQQDGTPGLSADKLHPVVVKRLGVDAETVVEVQPSNGASPSLLIDHPRSATLHSQVSEESKERKRIDIRWTKSEADDMPGIHWYYPVVMIFLALGGLFGALGHHLYNVYLDGREVFDAQWPQRWGVALAFFIKMMLGASVQTAFKQRAWLTIKKRPFKVKTLNSIFHACYDPAEFLDKDLFYGAFLPAALALLIWFLPLSAIATPSTLTVQDGNKTAPAVCGNVSVLNFNRENGFDMNVWDRDLDKNGLSFWREFDNSTSFYDGPSMDLRRIFSLAMLSTNPLQPNRQPTTENPSGNPVYVNPLQPVNPCPSGSNCTYSVTFSGPSYKCEERDEFGGNTKLKKSQLVPNGDLLYISYSSYEEDDIGRPLDWNITMPDYNNTGIWRNEPTLWFGYVWNTSIPATAEDAKLWDTDKFRYKMEQHVLECTLYNATYHFGLGFFSSLMGVQNFSIVPHRPLHVDGEIMAPWMPTYMEYSGFHGTGFLYRDLLKGNLTQPSDDDWATTHTDISQTDIADPGTGLPHERDFAPYVEAGFQSIFLSMQSDVKQYAQTNTTLACEVTSRVLVWKYNPLWLAVSYFVAVGLTFAAVGVGLHAMVANGYAMETNFSTFLTTTRNPELDAVVRGSSLGASPLKKAVRETKLRFGEVRTEGGEGAPHAAFGFPEQIRTLKKGKQYS